MTVLLASSRVHCVFSSGRSSVTIPSSMNVRSACAHVGMLGGRVAKPSIPRERPDEPDRAEDGEQHPPAHVCEQRGGEKRRQPSREVRAHEEGALHRAAIAAGKPARERARHVRPRAGFARAEQKSDRQQRRIAECEARHHGECRPPADDACEDSARADFVAPPAGRDLEQRVRQVKRAEHVPHLRLREVEIARDVGTRHADGDSIEIRDGGQRHRHGEHLAAHACVGGRGRHGRLQG